MLKPQWWVSCKPLAEEAIKVSSSSLHNQSAHEPHSFQRTRAGELRIAPKQSEADWFRWLENIQDWCVSRQLWWGHRCPAYFVRIEGQEQDVRLFTWAQCSFFTNLLQSTDGKFWVVGRNLEEATERAKKLAGGSNFTLEQDEDVLDTWFSSGLWPFSILGWPDKV